MVASYLQLRESKGLADKTIELERWRGALVERGIGRKRVHALTVADCDGFLRRAAAGEFSSQTAVGRGKIGTAQLRRVRSFMVRALHNEMRLGFVSRNVADLSEVPASLVETRPRRALSLDELHSLRTGATGLVAVLVELMGRYGLRPAEARAMKWTAIDLERLELGTGPRLNRANQPIGPKTKAATRTLSMAADSVPVFQRWQAEQDEYRRANESAWTEAGYVASNEIGEPLNYWLVEQALTALSVATGVSPPVAPYELRHTAITFQAEGGHSAWAIADWAGTSERMIADVYRHQLTETSNLGPAF
jgi:integrase